MLYDRIKFINTFLFFHIVHFTSALFVCTSYVLHIYWEKRNKDAFSTTHPITNWGTHWLYLYLNSFSVDLFAPGGISVLLTFVKYHIMNIAIGKTEQQSHLTNISLSRKHKAFTIYRVQVAFIGTFLWLSFCIFTGWLYFTYDPQVFIIIQRCMMPHAGSYSHNRFMKLSL